MYKLTKYNLEGKELGNVELPKSLFASKANSQMVKDVVVAIRQNLRQWSASTRDRSMVNHSTQKPHKQKGTGRARQGRLSSPQYKGGGCVFGPMPKFDQHVRINKKERRAVIRYILAEYAESGKIIVVEDPVMEIPKTKAVRKFVDAVSTKGRVLFALEDSSEVFDLAGFRLSRSVSTDKYDVFKKSQSNLPSTSVCQLKDLNAYQLLKAGLLVMTDSGFNQLLESVSEEVAHA